MFWIEVDVEEKGQVVAKTYADEGNGSPALHKGAIRERRATTVSQVLRLLATAMVTAKAELIEPKGKEPR